MRKLTKKQAKEFARIQSGVLIFNRSGEEFSDTELSEQEVEMLYDFMSERYSKLLKNNEHQLASTDAILKYVRTNF